MGFGRGFGGAPSKTDGGLKKIRAIRENALAADININSRDIKNGALSRTVSGTIVDTMVFTDVDALAKDLNLNIGDEFDFKMYINNPNRGTHTLRVPSSRDVSGLLYYGDLRGLGPVTEGSCIHEFNFFYIERGKMAITVSKADLVT